jgi:hypothetical protein
MPATIIRIPIPLFHTKGIFCAALETNSFPLYDEDKIHTQEGGTTLFILDGFNTLRESYVFYFATIMLLGISIIIASGRCYQELYKDKINAWWYYLMEVIVYIIRIIQYILIISLATDTAIRDFTSTKFWDTIFLSLYGMTVTDIIWEFVGFVIIFGIYNLILNMLFTKHLIAGFIKKRQLTKFSVESVQLAVLLGYKNLLLIPVSFIYILIVLKII